MHSTTICGSSLHVTIHLEAKNFWAKRKNKRMRANKNPKKRKNFQKEKRNEKPAAHNNDERSQAAKLVSKITVCVYLPVCVCAWGCVACLHYSYAMHGPRRVLTSFSYLNCPHIMPRKTNPTRAQLPKATTLNSIQSGSTQQWTEQNKTQVESRVLCLMPPVSSLGSAFIIIFGNGLRLAQAAKTWKLCHKFTTHPKKTKAEFALYFAGILGELISWKRAQVYVKLHSKCFKCTRKL